MPPTRGRPPNVPYDSENIRCWYQGITHYSGKKTSYALEKFYKEGINAIGKYDKFECTHLFRAQKHGDNFPNPKIVNWFDKKFSGSARNLISPFWKIIKSPWMTREELYATLDDFPYDIAMHLILNNQRALRYYERISSIDALAACLWVACELRGHFKNSKRKIHDKFLTAAFRIFCRIAAEDAFKEIYETIFSQFYKEFISQSTSFELKRTLNYSTFQTIVCRNQLTLKLINELSLFNTIKVAPSSCLPIAERYLFGTFLFEIQDIVETNEREKLRKHPTIKKLTRSLRRWENNKPPLTETVKEVNEMRSESEIYLDDIIFEKISLTKNKTT